MLKTAVEAARSAGQILMEGFGKLQAHQIGLKGMGDYVTEMDEKAEEAIIRHIHSVYPDHSVLAEESGEIETSSIYKWIIDPLDGTANYVQGIPFFSVSIAVMRNKKLECGVVFIPILNELFTAERNGGAFLNGRPIHVSQKETLTQAVLATGFPCRSRNAMNPYLAAFEALFVKSAGVRRMGSAAIDLAYTACGRFEGYWEMALNLWDIAAGVLLVQEAGGIISDFNGDAGYIESGNVAAGPAPIHQQIVKVTKQHLAHLS